MVELDLFRNFRRGVAAPSPDAHRRASARLARALDEATGDVSRELACAPAAVAADSSCSLLRCSSSSWATASAFGTVRDLFGNGKHSGERNNFASRRQEGEL